MNKELLYTAKNGKEYNLEFSVGLDQDYHGNNVTQIEDLVVYDESGLELTYETNYKIFTEIERYVYEFIHETAEDDCE